MNHVFWLLVIVQPRGNWSNWGQGTKLKTRRKVLQHDGPGCETPTLQEAQQGQGSKFSARDGAWDSTVRRYHLLLPFVIGWIVTT